MTSNFGLKMHDRPDYASEETESFLPSATPRKPRRCSSAVVGNILLCVALVLTVAVTIKQHFQLKRLGGSGSYSSGFETDFLLSRAVVELEEVAFTGGLLYHDNGTLYREIDETKPQYVGQPGPHIDKAWEDLMSALEVVIEGKEAEESEIQGKTIQEPDGNSYRLSLDVYHSLHCVNMARRAIDDDYYHRNGEGEKVNRLHVEHCLDYLRQTIQCSGDLTPLYYQYSEFRGRGFPVWGQKHTCRNFGRIHQWALSRHRDQEEGGPHHDH
ncbi:hypothetical protein VFPPC_14065 [Pochonia chlamydosporia 170]|uniref:Tat pathway signal sequence n=1 Tax=Pochonia chlamydosporia 170 TaxID=1380566 RepID=A0A179FK50_METCM|nr:hypothetical protein VFPPC_14065 [Pochonia chlamydosporia 170]OAQ65413.1 hypothetical protein VFPPC_14065 [Pochonia chlamydosporia 170]